MKSRLNFFKLEITESTIFLKTFQRKDFAIQISKPSWVSRFKVRPCIKTILGPYSFGNSLTKQLWNLKKIMELSLTYK